MATPSSLRIYCWSQSFAGTWLYASCYPINFVYRNEDRRNSLMANIDSKHQNRIVSHWLLRCGGCWA